MENRTGAAGTIGAQAVVQSTADGNTVLFASPAEVLVSRIAGQKTSYDAGKDLQPVTLAGETPLAVVVNPAVPARTLAELVALARKDPSAISYGTPGTGSTMQFAGEALNLAAGIKMLHVPYRGAAPAIADLLGNQIPVAIVGVPPLVAHHKSGKLRILAVTGSQRIAALPDVPTVAEELGVADYRYTNWFGVYVPGNTPRGRRGQARGADPRVGAPRCHQGPAGRAGRGADRQHHARVRPVPCRREGALRDRAAQERDTDGLSAPALSRSAGRGC
ncbi:putattive exported protein [Bordetella pertussis]|nr:putattive exported protein [Bordetella pertussis]